MTCAFRYESELVDVLERSMVQEVKGGVVKTVREWTLGPRIADLVVCRFPQELSGDEQCLKPLNRLNRIELRLLSELVARPLRPETLARRLFLRQDTVDDCIKRFKRWSLVAGTTGGALQATDWLTYVPNQIWLFEAKLQRWAEAVEQATYYRQFGDRTVVAMPSFEDELPKGAKLRCQGAGLALFTVGADGKLTVKVKGRLGEGRQLRRRRAMAMYLLQHFSREALNE